MADKSIGELPQAEYFDENSLLVVENQGQAKKVSGKQIQEFSALPIANLSVFAKTLPPGESATVEKQLVDGVYRLVFGIPSGKQGAKGDTPYIGINLNWWISGEDTGISAVGGGNSDSGSVVIQADLRENNQNASSYVKGRTHWKELGAVTSVLLDEVVKFSGKNVTVMMLSEFAYAIEVGETYFIVWDGVEYECVAKLNEFGEVIVEKIDQTGESFYLRSTDGIRFFAHRSSREEKTISIKIQTRNGVVYHPLIPEYIPDGVPYAETAKVGQTVVVSEVDADGKPTKWEAADVGSGGGDSTGIVVQDTPPEDTSMLWVDTGDGDPDESLYYTKLEIDAIMGSYVDDIDSLLGGDS